MSLPAWERIIPNMPDEFPSAFNGNALDAIQRERAEGFLEASRDILDVIGSGQTALSMVVAQIDDLELSGRHRDALLELAVSLGSAANCLRWVENNATEFLALKWPSEVKQ